MYLKVGLEPGHELGLGRAVFPKALQDVWGKLLAHEGECGVACWSCEGLDEREGEDLHPRAEDLDTG